MNLLSHKILKTLLALCLVTPVLAFSSVIFPYTVPKVFAFRVLVEIAAVFYLYLVLKYPVSFCAKIICHPERSEGSSIDSSSRNDGTQNDKKKNSHPERSEGSSRFINFFVLVFLVVSLLSALFGADFYSSFWGNLERGGGVFGLLHFVVFFFLLQSVFRNHEEWIFLIKVSVFTSAIISLLAALQHFFNLGILLPQADRVYSLIGNAGVFGSYLVFNIFLAGYLALSESVILSSATAGRRIYISLYSLFIILNSFALLLSGTRGAWLGLLAGTIVFLILSFFTPPSSVIPASHPSVAAGEGGQAGIQANQKNSGSRITAPATPEQAHSCDGGRECGMTNKKKQIVFLFLVLIFILIISLFFIRNSSFIQTSPILSRLTSISLSDGTAQNRLILWQGAWRAWQSKPLLGWGGENFEIANNKYFDPRLAPYEAWYDRAHNFIFDYGVTLGWLGLLSYLAIFIAAGWLLIKPLVSPLTRPLTYFSLRPLTSPLRNPLADPVLAQATKNNFYFPIIFLSLLAAYLVQNLFIFDSFVSYLMLFFILALISNICHPERSEGSSIDSSSRNDGTQNDKKESSHSKRSEGSLNLSKNLLLLFVIGILSFVIYSYNLKPFLSANYANQILSLPANEATQATPLLKNALALNSFASPEVTYQVTLDYIEKISQNPALAQNEEFYSLAAAELLKIIARSPNQSRNYVALSWLDLYFSGQQSTRLNESINLAQKVRQLSPNKKDAHLLLVAGYALSNQPQKANEIVDQALAIDAKMGEEVRGYYEKLK